MIVELWSLIIALTSHRCGSRDLEGRSEHSEHNIWTSSKFQLTARPEWRGARRG